MRGLAAVMAAGVLLAAAPVARGDGGTPAPVPAVSPVAVPPLEGAGAEDTDASAAAAPAEPAARRPRYLRAAVEEALVLLGGTAWYWIDRERQVADWDYPSLKQRLGLDIWRFDNNPFEINFLWHPLNGSAFHLIARSNDLGLLGSVGYGFATSMVWEYALEFREKVSVNDVIVTTGAGVAIGEFFFWLGEYLNSSQARDRGWRRAATWSLGFPRRFHDALDGREAPPGERFGQVPPIWHRFEVGYGLGLASSDATGAGAERASVHEVSVAGSLAALPGYLAPGRWSRGFANGNLTSLSLRGAAGPAGAGVALHADTILLGRHWQDVAAHRDAGAALTVGAAVAYDYRRQHFGPYEDRLGLMHLPGLAAQGAFIHDGWKFSLAARLHPDFAGVHALPYAAWKAAHPDVRDKTILIKQGYYYGWGWSARLSAELRYRALALGGGLFHGRYASQEGLDRSQEAVELDIALDDTATDLHAWMRLPLVGGYHLEARAQRHDRRGRVADQVAREGLTTYLLQLGASF